MKIPKILLLTCFICLPESILADERALQQALAKAQFMLKQATAEKLDLEKELASLKSEYNQFRMTAQSSIMAKEQGAQRLAGNVSILKDRYGELAKKYKELETVHREMINNSTLKDKLLEIEKGKFELCYENNRKLYDINQEILGNYQDKGLWEVLNESEPFTGFAAVKMEQFIQDYQYQNEDLKLDDSIAGVTQNQEP